MSDERRQVSWSEMADWARRKRVARHLSEGRADPEKCNCNGRNCLIAQAAADHFDHLDSTDD